MRKLIVLCITLLGIGLAQALENPKGQYMQPNNLFPKVRLLTSHGTLIVELDRIRAPIAVNNFLSYVSLKSYDNTLFHRLEPEFVLQGGGYKHNMTAVEEFKPIFNESGNGLKNRFGSIAMARQNDPHSATNQFFFNLNDNPNLDPGRGWGYTVFGQVQEGFEVLEAIKAIQTHVDPVTGWDNVPMSPIILKQVVLLPEA